MARGRRRASGAGLGRRLSSASPFIALAVLVGVMVLPSMVGRQVFAAGDLITVVAPWAEAHRSEAITNQCVSDTIDSVVPSLLAAKDRIAQGDLVPLWEDSASVGATLAATPAQGVSSPLAALALLVPDAAAPGWVKFLEIVAVTLGMVLWARRLGLTAAAGAVGSLVFVTSGFMVMWTNWPQTRTAAVFPLLFWAVERILQDRTWTSAAPFPLVLAALVLGGFPAIAVHAIYVAVAYAAVRWLALRRLSRATSRRARVGADPAATGVGFSLVRPLVLFAVGGLVAVAMTAFQLVPWAASIASVDLGYRANQWRETIPRDFLATTAFPLGFGTCGSEIPFWGAMNPVEANTFVGAAAIVMGLAAISLAPPARALGVRWFLLATTAFVFVVSFVGGGVNYLLQMVPLMGDNSLHRMRAVGAVMLAMLAAMGYDAIRRAATDRLVRSAPTTARWHAWPALVLGPALVGVMALHVHSRVGSTEGWLGIRPSLGIGLLSAGVAAGLWGLAMLVRRDRPAQMTAALAAAVLPVLVLAEGLVFTSAFWPRAPVDTLYPMTGTTAFLQENLGTERMLGHDEAYWRGAGRVDGLRSLDGHTFVGDDWRWLLHHVDREFFDSPTAHSLSSLDHMGSPVLDRLATAYVVSDLSTPVPGTLDGLGSPQGAAVSLTGREATRAVGRGDRVRAAVVDIVDPPADTTGVSLVVTVVDDDGDVLASAERRLRSGEQGHVMVPVAAERLPADRSLTASLRIEGAVDVRVGASPAGEPWLGLVVADPDDGSFLVHTSDAQVYERTTALPRMRWASSVQTCETPPACAAMMPGLPAETVLLAPDAEVAFDGRPAEVTVDVDSDDLKRIEVRAAGAGMLVLADALQDGWTARVDGRPVTLHRADGAMMGVAVPPGRHTVEIGYEPVGWQGLPALAALTFLGVVAVLLRPSPRRAAREGQRRSERSRRTRPSTRDTSSLGPPARR